MNRTFLFLAFILSFSVTTAQQPSTGQSLLWRVSGNGLQKPSYLYGTMHVRDKRVFNFADSVLLKLDECEAFSLEIDLDSAFNQMLSDKFSDNDFKLKNYLGEDEYDDFQRELAEKSGFDPSFFKNPNPFVLKYFVNRGNLRNDMPTFLDAHLYNIARENGKIFVPLENVKDQTNIITNLSKNTAAKVVKAELGLDKPYTTKDLLALYLDADLQEIDRTNRLMSDSIYQVVFAIRNHNMCRRIVEYAPKHSTFFAFGAGHLPGDEGVVSLLRKKGYTVTPIMPTYKGLAGKYKSRKLLVPWYTVAIPEEGYSVDMPTKMQTSLSINENIKACADAGTGMFYMCATLVVPENAELTDEAEKTKNILENYWKKQSMEVVEKRTVISGGKPVKEFLMKKYGNYFRVRLFYNDKYTYLLLVGGTLLSVEQDDANRFFNSVKFLPAKPSNWNVYTSPVGAFSIYFPGNPRETEVKVPAVDNNVLITRMIMANDPPSGIQYVVQYFDGPGIIFPSDSAFLHSGSGALQENLKVDSFVNKKVEQNGFPGLESTVYANNHTVLKSLLYLRGNRGYNLLALMPTNKLNNPDVSTFFNSFRMTEYGDTTWEKQSVGNEKINAEFPSRVVFTSELEKYSAMFDSTHRYEAFDKFTGNSFYFVKSHFQKYYSAPSYDSIFSQALSNQISEGDSVLSKRIYKEGQLPVMDVCSQDKTSHNVTKTRMFLTDTAMYFVFSYFPAVYRNTPIENKFFGSVDFTVKSEPVRLLEPKTSLLLADLKSSDSAVHYNAISRIENLSFTKADLNSIYQALTTAYISDTLDYGSARSKLFGAVMPMADSTYVRFFKEKYSSFAFNPSLQIDALEVLAKLKTTEARKLVFQTLMEKAPDTYNYSVFRNLRDSMELNVPYFPEILKLMSEAKYTENVLELTEAMMRKKIISHEILSPYYSQLYSEADKQLKEIKDMGATQYFYEYLIQVLSRLNTEEGAQKLQQYMASSNIYAKMYAALGLLRKGLKVQTKDLEKIASYPGFRIQLYSELDSLGKKSLFPSKYYTQDYFAESDIWNYFVYEDDEPSKMELKSVVERKYKGETKRFYCYKVTFDYEDEKTSYFAVSGPFPLKGVEITTTGELTGSSYTEFAEKTIEEHLKEYLGE